MQSFLIEAIDTNMAYNIVKENLKNLNIKTYHQTIINKEEKSIGIENIRDLKYILSRETEEDFHAVIIFNTQNMTVPAQNAFLKTLEEPPKKVFIFLVCENKYLLLPTIISRVKIISGYKLLYKNENIDNNSKKLLTNIVVSNQEKIMILCNEICTNKQPLKELDKYLLSLRKMLIESYLKNGSGKSHDLLKARLLILIVSLLDAKRLIKSNINSKFALELSLLNVLK